MSLQASALAQKIKANMQEKGFNSTTENGNFIDALAEAIVEELTTNAQVQVTVADGSSSGQHNGVIV